MASAVPDPGEVQPVCPRILFQMLDEARILERWRAGELVAEIKRRNVTSRSHGQVPGTETQIVRLRTHDGRKVAVVRRFVRPDGSLGASGTPRPEWLRVGDVAYRPSHRDPDHCPACEGHATHLAGTEAPERG